MSTSDMDDFNIPFLSVLDARKSLWRHRKARWHNLIGKASESREHTLYDSLAMRFPRLYADYKEIQDILRITFEDYVEMHYPEELADVQQKMHTGTSTFDPVLAELIYKWFTPDKESAIYDCFAGGITKGAVAAVMGHKFTGIELRTEQIIANNEQASRIGIKPKYVCSDARDILNHIGVATQDLFISCPPYYNLEKYSDSKDDASNQETYEDFLTLIQEAFTKAILCLKKNRFAVVIVGDIRDQMGGCRNFPGDIVRIFLNLGCAFINDIVFVRNDATANLRVKRYMNGRKMARIHERVLVFYKGKPANIKKYFPPLATYDDEE